MVTSPDRLVIITKSPSDNPIYPCGSIAKSVFKDEFFVEYKNEGATEKWHPYVFSERMHDIGWMDMDLKSSKFKQINPTENQKVKDQVSIILICKW